jgi:hypothetical protein
MTLPKVNKTKILTVVVFLLLLGASLSMFRANYDCSTTNGFYGCARAEELAKYHETRPYFERLSTDKGRLEYSLEKSKESLNAAKEILK